MQCPDCSAELQQRNIGHVSIDECDRCKSIWLDRGELEQAKDEIDPDLSWMDFDLWQDPARFQADETPFTCPKCLKDAMATVEYGDTGVRINYCPSCEGVWLKAADLNKIIERMAVEADEKNVSDYLKASLKEAAELIANPGNAISEWYDLKHVLRLLTYRFFVENPRLKNILVGMQKSLPL